MAYDALGSREAILLDLHKLADRVANLPEAPKTPGSPRKVRSAKSVTTRTTAYGSDISELREWMRTERSTTGLIRRKVRK